MNFLFGNTLVDEPVQLPKRRGGSTGFGSVIRAKLGPLGPQFARRDADFSAPPVGLALQRSRTTDRRKTRVLFTLIGSWLLLTTSPVAAQHSEEPWLKDAALQKVLASTLNVQSSNEGLRLFLERLGSSQRIAIFLDRRIDPTAPHDFELRERTLRSVLVLAAASADAGIGQLGDVIYVGPGDVATTLPEAMGALREQTKSLPAEAKKTWQRAEPWQLPRLSRPAQALRQLAESNQLALDGIDAIPHDLWPAIDLPPLSLAERFACLLIGFGLWPEISNDGKSVRIVKYPVPESITRTHTSQSGPRFSDWLRAECPTAKIAKKSSGIAVTASPADQQRIVVWLAENEGAKPSAEGKKVVTLNATSSTGAIARQVAAQLGVEFVCDRRHEPLLAKRVEIHVDQVSYPELLTQVFADTGLSFQLDERQLRVFAK